MPKKFLEAGKIVGTHGVRGDLKVQSWCDSPEVLCDFDTLYLDEKTPVTVEKAQVHKNVVLMHIKGIDTVEAAEAMIHPGVRLCDIDAAARDLITKAGYGEYFNHRLGHFIGQTDHEKGDVSAANTDTVKPGMIFSIEPGVYLPGKFGVRVEDLVIVTETGCEVLNHVDKHWSVVGV